MKGRKPDSKINGRGIRRGCEAAMVKLENLYFHEFDNEAAPLGVRRIQRVADSRPSMRPNIFIQPELISRLDPFRRVYYDECRPLLPSPSESPGAFLSEETLRRQAEVAASIWKIEPFPRSGPDQAASLNNCGYLSYKGAIQHTSFILPTQRTPVRTGTEQSGGAGSTLSGKKGSPSNSLKALSHRLKDILKSAMTDSDLRYIKGDELVLGGCAVDEVEICTPKHQDRNNQHTVTKDSVDSAPDPITHEIGFKEAPRTNSGTDGSGEDGFIDAVSLSSSSEDANDGEDTTRHADSHAAESRDAGAVASGNTDRPRAADSGGALALSAPRTQTDGAGGDQRRGVEAPSPTATPSAAVHCYPPTALMRFHLLQGSKKRLAQGTADINSPTLSSQQSKDPIAPQIARDRCLDTKPPAKSASQTEVGTRPVGPVPGRETMSDPSESRNPDAPPPRSGAKRGSTVIDAGGDVLALKSAHLISNVVEVNPSGRGGILQHLKQLNNPVESARVAALEATISSDDEGRPTGKLVDKKHSIELRRNSLYREFIDNYNEKRKTKFLKGIRIPLKKNDTQTTLQFGDLPNASSRSAGCGNTPPHSAPSDRAPALSTDDESPPHNSRYYGRRASTGGYARDHGGREYQEDYPPDDGYKRRSSIERYEEPRDYAPMRSNRWSSDTMYDSHVHHSDGDWYHYRPLSRQGSMSSMTASDGNTAESLHSSHVYRDRSFDCYDEYDSRSGCSRRTQRLGDYVRDSERSRHRGSELSVLQSSYPSEYRESYSKYRESDRYAPEHDRRDYHSSDYRSRDRDYAYRPRHRAYDMDAPRHYGRRWDA